MIRLMRISTSEVYDTNYVKAAATRGVSRRKILLRHVLHNALPPVIRVSACSFPPCSPRR